MYGDIQVSDGERVDEDTVLEKYSKDAEDGKEFDLSKEIQEA